MPQVELSALADVTFFCDPSAGPGRKGAGRSKLKSSKCKSAVVGVAQDALARIFVLHAWGRIVTTDALVDHIFECNEQWHPVRFGIEANAMQALFGDSVVREANQRGKSIAVVQVVQNTKVDKLWRIRTALQPVIAQGRLVVGADQLDLRGELAAFPLTTHLDMVDALASAIALLPKRAAASQISSEERDLARYLRSIGTPPDLIESRLCELRQGLVGAGAGAGAGAGGASDSPGDPT